MELREGDEIIGAVILDVETGAEAEAVIEESEPPDAGEEVEEVRDEGTGVTIFTVTERGFGKRTPTGQYRRQGRGGLGIIDIKTGDRNGMVVGAVLVTDTDEVMLITNWGKILRTRADQIRKVSRNTLGVKLMNMEKEERIVGVARLAESEEEEVIVGEEGVLMEEDNGEA